MEVCPVCEYIVSCVHPKKNSENPTLRHRTLIKFNLYNILAQEIAECKYFKEKRYLCN